MKTLNVILVTATAATLSLTSGVFAQQQGQAQNQPPPAQQQQPAADVDVSENDLEQFVSAQESIIEIQQKFSARLQEVEDPEKANELQTEANEEMIGAVEEAGLDVESFNSIAMAVQNDPELQQRLQEMME